MCGICGFNWKDQELIGRMNDQIIHRGPDQDGIYCDSDVSLGHRRLSIIDLSEHGRQPMFNEDRSLCLVYNGEIYNFQELRESLLQQGHSFCSNSDSEVILHGYEEYGVDVLEKLRGMFAFALYDRREKVLFLARDRLGIKPLYYYHKGNKLVFASEIKAILEDSSIQRRLNHQALYDYIGFEFVPAPATMFEDIYKVPAGHYLLCRDGEVGLREFWDLNVQQNQEIFDYGGGVERLRELLDYSVKSHLVADVPLGVFLSGGLDSSAIVAMMRRHISGNLKTFTIGYEDKTFSELDYASQVAKYFETDHQVLMLNDIKLEHVEQTLYHLDEPMTDLSTVPLYLLCQQARKQATVCLSGEGADESFAGYDRFKASKISLFFSMIPETLRKYVIGRMVDMLPDQPQKKGIINILKRFVEGANLPPEGHHLRWQYFSNEKQNQALFSDSFKSQALFDPFRIVREYSERCLAGDRINREIYLDMRYMMTDSVLMKVDKMSMASSLEVRVPLLDHVFVEFLASLPGNWKLKGMKTKHVFRSALDGLLPNNIVHRGKQGYSLPVKHLLRGEMKDYMVALLNESPIIRENMNVAYVNHLIQEHSDMIHNHNHVLWALINVAIWHNKFLAYH